MNFIRRQYLKFFVWFLKKTNPEFRELAAQASAQAKIVEKALDGANRMILNEEGLDWDQERERWTVTSFGIQAGEILVLWLGRGGRSMERALAVEQVATEETGVEGLTAGTWTLEFDFEDKEKTNDAEPTPGATA